MKAKVSRGGGFLGALNYVFDMGEDATGDKKPEHCGGNMSGRNPRELSKEFGLTKKLRPDCEKPVWHCSLALPVGDRLSAEKWGEISSAFMLEMGMDPANFLYVVERHNDKPNDHIHIVASRIGLDSSLWHGGRDVFTAIEATQKLEKQFGLTLTAGFDPTHKKEIKPVTSAELNMALRLEMKPPRMVCQEAIEEVLKNKGEVITAPDFINRLSDLGVRAVPSVASTGKMNGFSFETGGVAFTGSKLGDSYKWLQLIKRGVDYDQNRDFEELADARRRAAARATAQRPDESGHGAPEPDQLAIQQPERVAGFGGAAGDGSAPGARSTGPNNAAPEQLAPAAGLDGAASNGSDGALRNDAGPSEQSIDGLRPSEQNAARHLGEPVQGNEPPSSLEHAERGGKAGRSDGESVEPGQSHAVAAENDGIEHSKATGDAGGFIASSNRVSTATATRSEGAGNGHTRSTPPISDAADAADGGSNSGRNAGGDWASRFRKASAAKRDTAKRRLGRESLEPGNGQREKVIESDRVAARAIDPSAYLESHGFEVKKEGRHLSVRLSGDEMFRVTRQDDGHYVACDTYENGVGDNIALVQHIEPGTGFAEAVYRLAGAPSVARAVARPAPAPAPRQPPTVPAQTDADVKRGREYLTGRGISLETIEQAEKSGMLRYSRGAVLFVGRDERGIAQNIMRRSVDPSETVQKRDLAGTDKRHPQMLLGDPGTVWLVEGGTDALAAHDLAQRESRPVPTVLVTGGAGVRSFLETPWVQKVLRLAKRVFVAFEREDSLEIQVKTDAAHQLQMQRLREVCSADAEVLGWQPPEGAKDVASLNFNFKRPK